MAEQNIKSNYTPPRKKDYYKNQILLITFLFLFVIFIISNFIANKGIFYDVPGCFFSGLFNESPYFSFHDLTARYFSFIIATIPYNIFMPVIKSFNLLDKVNLFYISHLIMSGVLTALNFYVAKYTKRYDIAIYALFVYSFFYLPSSIWAIREIFIAFPIWFILLQFFVCKKKLNIFAKIIFLFSLIYSFESFEIFALLGVILFIFSILFAIKKDKKRKFKLTIGITSLIAAIYIVIKTILVATKHYNLTVSSNSWYYDLTFSIQNLFSTNFCISLFGIILICLFINKRRRALKFLSIFVFFCFIKYLDYLDFIPKFVSCKSFYSLLFLIMPLFFIFVLSEEYFHRKFIKNKSLKTIFSISLIIGIFQFIYLINGNIKFYSEYFIPFKTYLNSNYKIQQEDPCLVLKNYNNYEDYTGFTYFPSILIQSENPDKKIKTILLDKKTNIYYDATNDTIYFDGQGLKIKTKDWDLSPIKELLIKAKNKSKKTKQ